MVLMNGKSRKARSRNRAFTLLEVLMVVVIIGLLAAFVAPNFFGAGERAKRDLAQATVDRGLNGALDLYRTHMGSYPLTEDGGLQLLLEPPDDEELAENWSGPYLKSAKELQDPWGNEWIYENPGEYNETSYDLSSAGKDGEDGTEDDITNWVQE
jgi:general secretion pathway protein G